MLIDETWIKTNRARTHGRCRNGERLRATVPHGHGQTLTFGGARRLDRLTAPCVMDGPIDGERFWAYVEHCRVPILSPGEMVVLDNLRSHKRQAVHTALRKAGATRVLLPQYSPDLNPLEQVFATITTLLRQAAERTVEHRWRTLGQLLETIPPTEWATYFRNAGYAST